MSFSEKKTIEVMGATVPFFTYTIKETQYFEFDTSKCGPPEPMVNAMAGLKLVTDAHKKLVMINHKTPGGLLDKIGENFNISNEKMEDGRVKLTFSHKSGESEKADLTQTSCHG
ncbi:hypothetical protein KKC13_02015 [bacterium]|nr:hypothetical protein [bacterium]MBU1957652.1 hypothetical protein [bacterium]